MMTFENLTPHPVFVERTDGSLVEFTPTGGVARVDRATLPLPSVRGFRVLMSVYSGVTGLPEPRKGVTFIVSGMVRSALGDTRPDVVAPDTGEDAIRTPNGQISAVRGFIGAPGTF